MWNPFKNKNPPIDAGNYDWTFQFVRGGFAPNDAAFFNPFPKEGSNEIDPYKILIKFTPEEKP